MSKEQVYAIVRFDDFLEDVAPPNRRVAVVKVVRSQERAVQETVRLNDLNGEKDVHYVWQATRLHDS